MLFVLIIVLMTNVTGNRLRVVVTIGIVVLILVNIFQHLDNQLQPQLRHVQRLVELVILKVIVVLGMYVGMVTVIFLAGLLRHLQQERTRLILLVVVLGLNLPINASQRHCLLMLSVLIINGIGMRNYVIAPGEKKSAVGQTIAVRQLVDPGQLI